MKTIEVSEDALDSVKSMAQKLQEERDILLEALKTIINLDDGDTPDLWHFEKEFDEGREAIAKVEQG